MAAFLSQEAEDEHRALQQSARRQPGKGIWPPQQEAWDRRSLRPAGDRTGFWVRNEKEAQEQPVTLAGKAK